MVFLNSVPLVDGQYNTTTLIMSVTRYAGVLIGHKLFCVKHDKSDIGAVDTPESLLHAVSFYAVHNARAPSNSRRIYKKVFLAVSSYYCIN